MKKLKALPTSCDVGTQKSAKDDKESGVGYKLHLDGSDGDIPISGILTSASLHDSQTAIPLAQMSAERVTSLYDLMDAPYDAPEIHAYSKRRGHAPIIDQTPRRGEKKQMDPPEKSRDKERSASERVNSNQKTTMGASRSGEGEKKVACHLRVGLVALRATQLFKMR